MKIVKLYKGIWILFLLFLWFWNAQEQFVVDDWWCPEIDFSLLGQDEVKSNQLYEYTLVAPEYNEYATWLNIKHSILKDEQELSQFVEESFSYDFNLSWSYLINTNIELTQDCVYSIQTAVNSYDQIILYIWKWSEVLELSRNQNWSGDYQLLFKEILIDSTNSSEILQNELSSFVAFFRYADSLIIDTSSQWLVFETLWKVFSLNEIDTWNIDVYVIADTAQSYFRRLLARYVTASWLDKVYVTQEQYFGSLFTSLLLKENPQQYDFVKAYSLSLEDSNKWTFLSYMTDYLLINWFPLGILTLVLLLPLVWLLVSVARQIIWISVFWVFTPLLFAISMYVIGLAPSFLLLLSATIAVLITNFISKKIYLLYSPKISLMIILYCIISILIWWGHEILDLSLVTTEAYANNFAIFPFVVILLVAKWVFSDSFLQFKKGWWIDLIEFFVMSLWVLFILNSTYLQNIFLGNPELLLVVLILNILVGRFTWLQFAEYFRFFPLIKNYFEEE